MRDGQAECRMEVCGCGRLEDKRVLNIEDNVALLLADRSLLAAGL